MWATLRLLLLSVLGPYATTLCFGFPQVRIVTFGDSLTVGEHVNHEASVREYEPYANTLFYFIQQELSVCDVRIEYSGRPGITAAQMVKDASAPDLGILPILADGGDTTPTLTVVVILAGTNDLIFYGQASGQATAMSVNELHHAVLNFSPVSHTIRTVALGIPRSQNSVRNSTLDVHRSQACDIIEAAAREDPRRAYFPCPIPSWLAPESERHTTSEGTRLGGALEHTEHGASELWDLDGLHFSKRGYQELGRRLSSPLARFIEDSLRAIAKVDDEDTPEF